MTSGLHIDRVEISGFRGLAEALHLDLTSPVTLVFAPNGTGKTTFCEAIEWLVTGQVERLRHGSGFDQEQLRSVFDPNIVPKVVGDIRVGQRRDTLTRDFQGASWKASGSLGPGDLLAILAPAAAAPDAHHLNAIRLRQHYIRGTRFLTGEALGALVDSDDETINRRTQVFADLLGIRHLLDAERDSGKFVTEIAGQLRFLDSSLDQLLKEESELEAEIAVAANSNDSALAEVAAAERLLAINPTGKGDLDSRLQAASASHSRALHDIERRGQALDQLAKEWSRRLELEQRGTALRERESAGLAVVKQHETAELEASPVVDKATVAVERLRESARRIEQAEGALRRAHADLSERLGRLTPSEGPSVLTYAAIRTMAPSVDWTEADRSARLGEIANALSALPRVRDTVALLNGVEIRRTALLEDFPTPDELEDLAATARDLQEVVASARADLDATAGPVESLRAAGLDFVQHLHDGNPADCPLCGHDWHKVETLKAAIDQALAQSPALIRSAQALLSRTTAQAREAKRAYDEAWKKHIQSAALEREAGELRATIERDTSLFNRLGISLSAPDLEAELANAELHIKLGAALAAFVSTVSTHREVFGSDGQQLWVDGMGLDDVFADLNARLNSRRTKTAEDSKRADAELVSAAANLTNIRGRLTVAQAALNQCRRELAEVARDTTRLDELWSVAAGAKPWSRDGLESLKVGHDEAKARLSQADRHLAAAKGAWGAELRRSRLSQLKLDILPLREKRGRLVARQNEGVALQGVFRDTYASISKEQIGGLSRVVNSLFSRMHANRVVDQIDLGHAEAFLRWAATAGAAKLDPGKDFSQGQRQDLALSLFLARARGLGGTFFLDEPLAHLDDLNRVGLLDVFRAVAVENAATLNLVITTASRNVARHMVEKFGSVDAPDGHRPMLRVIELAGNGRLGVAQTQAYPRAA